MEPRVVVVTRADEITSLRATYGTVSNAAFNLRSRGGDIAAASARSELYLSAVDQVLAGIPSEWRRARVDRAQLDRFLFEPDDIVAVVGQDGLVANVAKYLKDRQLVIGFNDNKAKNPGILVKWDPAQAHRLFPMANHEDGVMGNFEKRTMVKVTLDDGQELTALNEVYIGHHSHQSSKYTIAYGEKAEAQSSSGVIVSTGTGYTGWCSSIMRERGFEVGNPLDEGYLTPTDPKLVFLVREPWVSPATGNKVDWGFINRGENLLISSAMEEGGVIFGDGMEVDHITFDYGRVATVTVADNYLRLR